MLAICFSPGWEGNYQTPLLQVYLKSDWEPPVQQSVALESYMYLDKIKVQLAKSELRKPNTNLPHGEGKAVLHSKNNSTINIKKADKGTTTVVQ